MRRITPPEFVAEIGDQFKLSSDQSCELIERVIETGEQALPEESIERVRDALPGDMKLLI